MWQHSKLMSSVQLKTFFNKSSYTNGNLNVHGYVNNGSMFPVLVFASHFQILLVRKPDTRPECFTTHLVVPYRFVYNTQCVSTQNDIDARNRNFDHKFLCCPSASHVWRYDVASRTAHTFTGVASLCWTWRQWCHIRWMLRVNLAHFLDAYNPKIVYNGTFTWIYL
jgi:hypothetical protein